MKNLAIVLILAIIAVPAVAQGGKESLESLMQQKRQAEKTAAVLREITQSEYRAQMDIPASDSLFVEDGKLTTATYRAALKNGVALKAGETTRVTQVKLMDFGVQVFFANGACALIGWADKFEPANQTVEAIAGLAKKTLLAVFEPVATPGK